MKVLRTLGLASVILLALGAAGLWTLGLGVLGNADSEDNIPTGPERPAALVAENVSRVGAAATAIGARNPERQILFGDLHVHTTISFDAFMLNLPVTGGQGAHPPADACDFARHCAALDFWSINDHASNILPADWQNTIEGIRQCNALAGDASNPDTVAFLGWEWTQSGKTPETHYGHKNVVLAGIEDDEIPTRPIAAQFGGVAATPPPAIARGAATLGGARFHDLALRWTDIGETPICPEAPVAELPNDCVEIAPTPDELFRKLDEWDHEAIVIPHGTAWGVYTPPGSTWDKQLAGDLHDPDRQTLIEVYSGHGDSEVYRDWRAVERTPDDGVRCPPDRPDYTPMCQRAGQIVEERCLAEGTPAEECTQRAEQARQNAASAGVSPHITVPGVSAEEWLDAGQCRDCDQAAFNYRPGSSAQYIAAIGNFDESADDPRRFRMGFIAASDVHTARPGIGYKEVRALSESRGTDLSEGGIVTSFLRGEPEAPESRTRPYAEAAAQLSGLQLYETERVQSMLYTGGLVAVHAEGRDRESIWSAMKRKEVYGTSGPRMLLWFDLLGEGGSLPMGSEVQTRDAPIFRVRAVGSFEQAPGCPDHASDALGPDEIDRLCRGECYHPTDSRRPITRIELVRIRPQTHPDEDVAGLIDDPWQSFDCAPDPNGCVATFADPEYSAAQRDTVYYARAFEAEIDTVNGDPLSCELDENGTCVKTTLCQVGSECLAPYEPRAWSSPIYVDYSR
ncbi:MAG: DUF3604 domain-containing protein [Deltaproteobacteria bacterium]|nr:DUF3604 domain-containing protein [Deltaproteobacteria bacterium]